MWEDDDEDDFPEEPEGPRGMKWEPEKTFRAQIKFYMVPKMVKLTSGELIIGTLINETFEYLELKWPLQMLVNHIYVKEQNDVFPMINLIKYAPGVQETFITLNKDACVFWNDTDSDLDKFYYNRIADYYKSAKKFSEEALKENEYPEENDPTIESAVTQLTVGKRPESFNSMLKQIAGLKTTPTSFIASERSEEGSSNNSPTAPPA